MWIFRVENPKTASTDTFTTKREAVARAKKRAARECGQVAVFRAFRRPSGVINHHMTGAGRVWVSEWRACNTKRRSKKRSK